MNKECRDLEQTRRGGHEKEITLLLGRLADTMVRVCDLVIRLYPLHTPLFWSHA